MIENENNKCLIKKLWVEEYGGLWLKFCSKFGKVVMVVFNYAVLNACGMTFDEFSSDSEFL